MRNTIDPSYTTIGMLFEKNFLFEVPKYQRYYSWEDEQVDDFIKDVKGIYLHDTSENTIEHFFGGIVAVEKRIPGSNRQQRELIDGQQRITTTLLLIIALIRKYEKLKEVSNGTLIDNRINKLRQKYLRYDDEINREPITVQKLVLSKADKQYFEDLIEARECTERRDSHRRINRAFKKLEKFVAGIIDAEATVDAKIDALAKIENIVHNNCTIIFIDSKTRESAYRQHRANGLLSRKSIPTMNHDRDTPLKCLHVRTDSSRQTWSVSQNQIRKCE